MIVIAGILLYLAIGLVVARITYSYQVEDHLKREGELYSFKRSEYMDNALFFGLLWPLTVVVASVFFVVVCTRKLISRPTKTEKQLAKEREMAELAKKAKELDIPGADLL